RHARFLLGKLAGNDRSLRLGFLLALWFREREWRTGILAAAAKREEKPTGKIKGLLNEPGRDLGLDYGFGAVSGFVPMDAKLVELIAYDFRREGAERGVVQHVVEV